MEAFNALLPWLLVLIHIFISAKLNYKVGYYQKKLEMENIEDSVKEIPWYKIS